MGATIIDIPFNKKEIDGFMYYHRDYDSRPVVYLIKGEKHIYIGETTNAYKRMKDHLKNIERTDLLNKVLILYDPEYNKSATLDIESKLIEYISGEDSFVLQNRNDGIRNHHYYDREKYLAKFEEIRKDLQNKKIVSKDLNEIRNSDLFKYSPYKSLNDDQYNVVTEIYEDIKNKRNGTYIVNGEPGTGKSVVASYLVKYLKDKNDTKNLKVGLVVPMAGLRNTFKKIFKNIDGLKSSMVIGPNEIAKDYSNTNKTPYDILIVDEAHRLQKRKNIMGYGAYDDVNKKLGLSKESTQLDRLINLSKTQILFYDKNQSIKPSDVNPEDFDKVKQAKHYVLKSQMRVEGGNDYLNFINNFFDLAESDFSKIQNYDFKLFDNFKDFRNNILERDKKFGLSRIVAGYARSRTSKNNPNQHDIEIDGVKMFWNTTNNDWVNSEKALHEIGCIHTVQGYDLNYVGVILGNELSYNKETGEFIINKDNYYDKNGKNGITDMYELKRYIINIYKTLMTRGIKGTYIYVVDDNLREYLKSKIK